jgi:hypothetical protein
MIPNLPSSARRNLTPVAVEFLTQAWNRAPGTPAAELHTAVRRVDSMFTYEARMLHYTLAYNEAIRYQHDFFASYHLDRFVAHLMGDTWGIGASLRDGHRTTDWEA